MRALSRSSRPVEAFVPATVVVCSRVARLGEERVDALGGAWIEPVGAGLLAAGDEREAGDVGEEWGGGVCAADQESVGGKHGDHGRASPRRADRAALARRGLAGQPYPGAT